MIDARAEAELSQAIDAFNDTTNIKSDRERYEKTLAAAQKTYDQYRSLPAGNIALYYVGFDCRQRTLEGYLLACKRGAGQDHGQEHCC